MRDISLLKAVLVFASLFMLCGCYEKRLTAPFVNPTHIWLVNETGQNLDSLDIGNSGDPETRGILYYSVPAGASVKVILPIIHEIMLTEPGLCQDMINSYTLMPEELAALKSNCQPVFAFTKQDLYEAARPLLAEEYATCLFLYSDGSLEARTEHSTPWPWKRLKGQVPCSDPNVGQAVCYEPWRDREQQPK